MNAFLELHEIIEELFSIFKILERCLRVAVIGAGFSGLVFAVKLAEIGLNVVVYEEHESVGIPTHCTGLVSSQTVKLIGNPAQNCIERIYDSLELIGKRSKVTIVVKEGIVKLDRVALEKELLRKAEKIGVETELGVRVERVTPEGEVKAKGFSKSYDVVVLAEGYRGELKRTLGLDFESKTVYGVNRDYPASSDGKAIEVYLGERFPYGFFAWRLYRDREITLGLGAPTKRAAAKLLEKLEKTFNLKSSKRSYGGIIVLGPPAKRFRNNRVVIVGDAAALNKPLTGGGLYPNALAAEISKRLIAIGEDPLKALQTSLESVAHKLRRVTPIARVVQSCPLLVEEVLDVLSSTLRGDPIELDYDNHLEDLLRIVATVLRSPRTARLLSPNVLKSLFSCFKL
ncbi:MAG: NAD(P)/FAD-dependent oxidoreductase [Acidilobaceae archaeon]